VCVCVCVFVCVDCAMSGKKSIDFEKLYFLFSLLYLPNPGSTICGTWFLLAKNSCVRQATQREPELRPGPFPEAFGRSRLKTAAEEKESS